MTIVKVYKADVFGIPSNVEEGIKVNITLKENVPFGEDIIHHAQYTIDVAKIRQKRLNLLLNSK
jgi:O-phosphoseryl-tRNA(Cys) synthetase